MLHEIVEIRLSEEDPDIDFLNAQILTTFFERCLKDALLRGVCEVSSLLGRVTPLRPQEIAKQQAAEKDATKKNRKVD